MFELTGFQRDLMYVIGRRENLSGQKIKELFEDIEEISIEINHGRLYPNLDTLVNRGLVKKGTLDRRTNSYQLTEKGIEMMKSRREWENHLAKDEIMKSTEET